MMNQADFLPAQSQWIWPEGEIDLYNCHAQFRHDFVLESVPESAPLYLTADQQYKLHINGRYVCRGPARGYQSHWPCDEVDVASFLHEGHNFIAIEAYNPGIGTFQYIHCSKAGFLCAAQWGTTTIRTSPQSWRMRRSPAHRWDMARLSTQMGFQEDFDAAKDDRAWITSPDAPEWETRDIFQWHWGVAAGTPPWESLEPRTIPMLREELSAPAGISSCGTGKMFPGWENCRNLSWHWREHEVQTVSKWNPGSSIPARIEGDAIEFTVGPTASADFSAVTIDLGAIKLGTPVIETVSGNSGAIIDFHFHQFLPDGRPERLIPVGRACRIGLAARLRTAAQERRHEFFALFGARHVTLVFRRVTAEMNVRVSWRGAEYPFHMRGEFHIADPELNAIHAICRHTQQICASDAYLDTPWREQGQWWGDARVQARNTFFLDGDARLLRRGIRSIGGQRVADGLTSGVAPCCGGGCVLPDFSLTWVLTVFDYYWQTGDLSLFTEQQERIRGIFAYFESSKARNADGLLVHDPRYWLFEDWSTLPKEGIPAFLNFWHFHALNHYQRLLEAAGMEAEANELTVLCISRKKHLEERFYDSQSRCFRSDLRSGSPPSVHDQVLAILLDLVPESHQNLTERFLLPCLTGETLPGAVPSAFWSTYLFEAAEKQGCNREVIASIRANWRPMLQTGTTWEEFRWEENADQSCCHAWSAHPASHLVVALTNLRQLAPRWEILECDLQEDLLTECGRILLPLPEGDFLLEWDHAKITVVNSAAKTARVNDRLLHYGESAVISRK